MTNHLSRVALRAVLLSAVSIRIATAAEPFNPHKIPQAQFAQQIQVVALRPVMLPWDTQQADVVSARFETAIAETLRGKGYTVVAAAEHDRQWRQLSERAGGAYDPMTGTGDEKKLEVIRTHTARELERIHQADAVLVPWVVLETVLPGFSPWSGDMQLWGEPVVFHGQSIRGLPQRLIASKVVLSIADISGVELYGGQVGLEWRKVFVARGYDMKPADQMYSEARLRHTLGLILDPMVARSTH